MQLRNSEKIFLTIESLKEIDEDYIKNKFFDSKEIIYNLTQTRATKTLTTKTEIAKEAASSSFKQNVKIFNLNKPLEPISEYEPIKCRLSEKFFEVATTLCVHDLQNDFVSSMIWRDGIWERPIISNHVY